MTPEQRAARERKQKIFVVVGGLFLVALLAFQLPKLLGGSSSPDAAAATTTDASAVAGQPIVTPGTVTPVTPATPVSQTSKLTSLSVFSAKDPFIQQAVTPTPSGGDGAATAGKGGGDAKGAGAKPEATRSQSFTTGTPTSTATIVIVNGRRQALTSGQKFPASDPVFVLVAENPKAKTVSIGIAGGGYESGGATTTLKVGKPLELVNTATGARYRIKLLSVGSGEAQAAPEKSQAQP
jgi:hypothetical protein